MLTDYLILFGPVAVIGIFLLIRDLKRGQKARDRRRKLRDGNTTTATPAPDDMEAIRTTSTKTLYPDVSGHQAATPNTQAGLPDTTRQEPPLHRPP